MKKSPHGLKIDRRKSLINNVKDNGLQETMKENRSENSGFVKIKKMKIKKLERKSQEQLANGHYDQNETTLKQIEKLRTEIEKYLSE